MCVQYVEKPSLILAILPAIEIFIEENNQTLPRLLLQRRRSRRLNYSRLASIVLFMFIDSDFLQCKKKQFKNLLHYYVRLLLPLNVLIS